MATPRIVLVVNPQAQNGQLGRRWPELSAELRGELGAFEEARTAAQGDATRLTREAIAAGATLVVAVGGDGTINEVVNGFFDGGRPVGDGSTALGVLPFGTGGDFRRTISLPRETREAARVLAAGHTRAVDVGCVDFVDHQGAPGRRMFMNVASFGMSGLVCEYANRSSKRLGGRISFMTATVRAAMRHDNQRIHLSFDAESDHVDLTINTVAVANGRYFGGGMRIAPEAQIDDGKFDVIAIGDMGKVASLWHGRRIYAGTHLNLDKVSCRRARELRAEPIGSEPVRLEIDGETPGVLPATFRVLPGALRLVTPGD